MVIRKKYTDVWLYENGTEVIDGSPNGLAVGLQVTFYAKNGKIFLKNVHIDDITLIDETINDTRTFTSTADLFTVLQEKGFFEHRLSAWQ